MGKNVDMYQVINSQVMDTCQENVWSLYMLLLLQTIVPTITLYRGQSFYLTFVEERLTIKESFSSSISQGFRQVVFQLNHLQSKLRLAQGKQYLRDACPKGKLETIFFSCPIG